MRLTGVLALLALALAGCGGRAADLIAVQRTGSIPGAKLRLVVSDDGRVRCNGGPDEQITSDQLIEARAIVRELVGEDDEEGPAVRGVRLPPGRAAILRYDVTVQDGRVVFSDTSRGQPPVFFRVARLVRGIARGPCDLPR